jgi:hypothetical protein
MAYILYNMSNLVRGHGMKDIGAAFTRVACQSFLFVLTARLIATIAFLEDRRQVRANFGELLVWNGAWVMDYLQ